MEEIKDKTDCGLLTGNTRTEYIGSITELVYNFITGICNVSDRFQVDRDGSMEYAAGIIDVIATTSSIREFEIHLSEKR